MTTIDPTSEDIASDAMSTEPELCWLKLTDLAPHPDNPRSSLGDLTELIRSIRSHGILEPLVVLPADENGVHRIIAGHRRQAAGIKAGLTDVPAVVRHMTAIEVIEAMLSENVNRSDLTVAEEVRAIERLMSLDEGLTPAKLCRRIGRSQAWVRSRMAVTILPSRWRTALDSGDLSLAAGEAAASAADLGPDHLDIVCDRLAGNRWGDPARVVTGYRDELRRTDAYEQAVVAARSTHQHVFTTDEPPPQRAKPLGELFDPDGCIAHVNEPCHAVVVRRLGWGNGYDRTEVCVDPSRHARKRVGTSAGSDLASDRTTTARGTGDDSHAKRQARLSRLAHSTDTFAKARGGFSQPDLVRTALRALILEAGRDSLVFAATMLGHAEPRDITAQRLLDGADSPAALTRIAGAIALGHAESRMYWSSASEQCRDYLGLLTSSGWTPDDWTSSVLDRHSATENPVDGNDDDDLAERD